ncbi:MAG: pilus assembly protein TadG-related protein [Pseudomonadota bacterium]|nr:pilus assembly protein TadG-related protein [Pseudomonadota bacterium]
MSFRSRRAKQGGAVSVFAAIAVGAALSALALAIDVGRLYAAQRDLQRITDLAALDAARVAGGCLGVPADPATAAYNEVLSSITRNSKRSTGVAADQVEIGSEAVADGGLRVFQPSLSSARNAVRVSLRRPAPTRLLPLMPTPAALRAVAAAQSRPSASVHVGSTLVSTNPTGLNRYLSQILSGRADALNIDAFGYNSLADAAVPLDQVFPPDETGDGTRPDEVPVAGMFRNIAEALFDLGNSTAGNVARQLADATNNQIRINPEDILSIGEDVTGDAPQINVAQLTLLATQAASESAAIELLYRLPPPFGDTVPEVRIIDPGEIAELTPQETAGPDSFASNSQALINADVRFRSDLLNTEIRLPVWLQLAQATAVVTDIECARSGQPEDIVTVDARSSAARIGIGVFPDINAPSPQAEPAVLVDSTIGAGLLGIPAPVRVRVMAAAIADIPSGRSELVIPGPFPSDPQPIGGSDRRPLSSAVNQLARDLQFSIEIEPLGASGEPLAGLLNPVLAAAINLARAPLEQALRTSIAEALAGTIDPLLMEVLGSAGLSVGTADVQVMDVVGREPQLFIR